MIGQGRRGAVAVVLVAAHYIQSSRSESASTRASVDTVAAVIVVAAPKTDKV